MVRIHPCPQLFWCEEVFEVTGAGATVLTSGSSSVGRATAFQAVGRGFEPRLPLREVYGKSLDLTSRCSSGVEHFLGKEEVESSILFNGSVVNI